MNTVKLGIISKSCKYFTMYFCFLERRVSPLQAVTYLLILSEEKASSNSSYLIWILQWLPFIRNVPPWFAGHREAWRVLSEQMYNIFLRYLLVFMLNAYLMYIYTSFCIFSVVAAVPQRYLPPHRRPRLGQHERIYVLNIFCHLVFVIMLAWLLRGQEKWFFIDSKDSLDALLML